MKESNERPVCHRADDLVTYLYNEATETEARDFANHAAACDACRAELVVFRQVHESISVWRNEALGSTFSPEPVPLPVTRDVGLPTVPPRRRLSALDALREFFAVSPLWLRGATAFAALLLSVLAVLAVSRLWNKPAPLANQPTTNAYSQEEFEAAVAKEVKLQMELLKSKSTSTEGPTLTAKPAEKNRPTQLAENRTQTKTRPRGLTRQEREQLASDLRLIYRDDDDLPFVFSEEPNQ